MAIFIAKVLAKGAANIPVSGTVSGSPYNCVAGFDGVSLFSDVAPTSGDCKHIHYVAAQKVTSGCTDSTYCPHDKVTRIEMASFIAKALVAPLGGAAIPFSYDGPGHDTSPTTATTPRSSSRTYTATVLQARALPVGPGVHSGGIPDSF